MTSLQLLRDWGPLVAGIAAGIIPWIKLWQASRRQEADLVAIAQEAAASVIGSLRQEIGRLEKQVATLRLQNTEKERRAIKLEAEVAALRARLETHEASGPGGSEIARSTGRATLR